MLPGLGWATCDFGGGRAEEEGWGVREGITLLAGMPCALEV